MGLLLDFGGNNYCTRWCIGTKWRVSAPPLAYSRLWANVSRFKCQKLLYHHRFSSKFLHGLVVGCSWVSEKLVTFFWKVLAPHSRYLQLWTSLVPYVPYNRQRPSPFQRSTVHLSHNVSRIFIIIRLWALA